MVDLINGFQEGMRNILNWRNRYTEDEYPGKVVLNIFYRKYSMEAMWDDMLPYINHSVRKDFNEAVRELEMAYSRSASFKVHLNSATLLIVSGKCGQNRPECDFSCSNWLFAIS